MPKAIVRAVSPRMAECELTHLERQPIRVPVAEKQHEEYMDALRILGCELLHAEELPFYPDSVFVEDCAIVLDELAIIARPGAESRRGEVHSVAELLEPLMPLFYIESPGLLDGGDVLRIGKEIWVGISGRTNRAAIQQMREIVEPKGYTVEEVELTDCLHLKSAVTQVAENTLLLNPDWVDPDIFEGFDIIETHPDEPGAANALLINGTVIFSSEFPITGLWLAEEGIELYFVDNSEVIKAEGGVTCCSVVF